MLAQSRDSISAIEEEFSRPVESIMRCEDFKSNFARKLSNRYISRSSVSVTRQESVLKFRVADKQEILSNVPERIEQRSQLSMSSNAGQNGEIVKPPDKITKNNTDIRRTEVNVLNMEVETLRWQLTQTEANRQMHIALLKQIVTFLNRVKEHIEFQKNDLHSHGGSKVLPRSLNVTDLPRSRSVLHVNKNIEYTISPVKKISTRKMSKSISNVNGYKDCSSVWNQSKLSLVSENETGQKLSEEMSRLITLANTVLSTKLPDLACSCIDHRTETLEITETGCAKKEIYEQNIMLGSLNAIEEDITRPIVLKTNCNNESFNGGTNELRNVSTRIFNDFIVPRTSSSNELENHSNDSKVFEEEQLLDSAEKVVQTNDKRNGYNVSSSFIEDESGFSSMSSFQEIGIPIISIIPPSPCKEVDFLEAVSDETEKWKTDAIDLEKQSVKVFWV